MTVGESGFQICKRKVQEGKLFLEMGWIVVSCLEGLILRFSLAEYCKFALWSVLLTVPRNSTLLLSKELFLV